MVKFNTIAKLIPLLILIFFGWKAVTFSNLHINGLPSIETLGSTSLILFFAFLGGETGLIVGGEVINPKRTIPKAVFISIAAVIIIYILIQTIAQGVLGSDLPNFKSAPLAETAAIIFGTFGFVLLLVGTVVSMFGTMSGSLLNSPRVVYALARDKVIPIKALSQIHKSFGTPYISIIIYGAIGFTIAATSNFEKLAVIASSTMLIIYLGVALSVIKLRKSQKKQPGEFEIPGGLTVPILAILVILYFLSHLSKNEMIGTGIFIGILSLIFWLIKIYKRKIT